MTNKIQFASKIGLIAATVGSAVGLGNVWRFPAEAQANGGAAFLVIYILCVFLLGVPVMVSEFALGRAGGSDAIGSFKNLGASRRWWSVGGLAILASYLILCFYMVVSGWTLEYLWQSITGDLFATASDGDSSLNAVFTDKMGAFISDGFSPLVNTYVMIAINLAILMIGVRKGIERISNVLMPLLFIILIIFICVALTLPKASDGLEFFLKPDFSKITPSVVLNALGQAFFSLSLGMGILITYSSYFKSDTRLTRTAVIVSMLDLLVAVMMGLIIFPAVMSFNLSGDGLEGTTLVFVTLPEVFAHMPASQFWAILFFLLLTVAALTSTISIAEVSVAFVQARFKMSRIKSCLSVLLPLFVFSSVCSLSQGELEHIRIAGLNIFDFLDTLATNILLPTGSFFLCLYVGWFMPKGVFIGQMSNAGTLRSSFYRVVTLLVRYVAPPLIALVLISNFI